MPEATPLACGHREMQEHQKGSAMPSFLPRLCARANSSIFNLSQSFLQRGCTPFGPPPRAGGLFTLVVPAGIVRRPG